MGKGKSKFIGFLPGLGLALLVAATPVSDGFLEDFLQNFRPAASGTKSDVAVGNQVPAYRPVVDYEQAVIRAVGKASPAVVAITISKNVPIIENCRSNPFGDLPPEFLQFFGDQFQFQVP